MAITAVKLFPTSPEIVPDGGGLFSEIWQLTGDGAATTVTVTTDSIRRIKGAVAGASTNNVTASSTNSVLFTYATALGNGLTQQAVIWGKA